MNSFKTNELPHQSFDQGLFAPETPTKCFNNISNKKQVDITAWLQSYDISFPISLIPQKFAEGSYLCFLLNKLLKKQLKYYQHPLTPLEKKFNIRKALGTLRKLSRFQSDFVWNEDDIFYSRGQVIWLLLDDLKKYCDSKAQECRNASFYKTKESFKKTANLIQEADQEQVQKEIVLKVRPWLEQLELSDMLASDGNYMKDNIRNGVILCHVLKSIIGYLDFCESPTNPEEVYNNIEIAVSGLSGKVPVRQIELYLYTEPAEVWSLLHTVMMFYPNLIPAKKKNGLPYNEQETEMLKQSLISWMLRLGIKIDPSSFSSISSSFKTGEVLANIVKKVTGKEVIGIQKNPKRPKVCISNIEKSLKALTHDRKIPNQYLRNPKEIYEGNEEFIMLFLEDLHRSHVGISSRKRGKSTHTPFIVPSSRGSMTPQRSYSSFSKTESCSKKAEPQVKRKLINNSFKAIEFYLPAKPENLKENLAGFEWVKKIGAKLPENLDLSLDKIDLMADGKIFCDIIGILEYRDIEGVSLCKAGTPAARRNIRQALSVLTKKPNLSSRVIYIEDQVFASDGESIRLVLSEIYRVYKSTIVTLIRFNRKYRNSSFV